jgi:hypothetical protein
MTADERIAQMKGAMEFAREKHQFKGKLADDVQWLIDMLVETRSDMERIKWSCENDLGREVLHIADESLKRQ